MQGWFKLFWINPRSSTQQNSSFMSLYFTSRKSSNKEEPDMLETAGLVWFYGISTIVSYLMLNPFLYIWTVLFPPIQYCIRTQFKNQKNSILKNSV